LECKTKSSGKPSRLTYICPQIQRSVRKISSIFVIKIWRVMLFPNIYRYAMFCRKRKVEKSRSGVCN